MEWIRDRRKKLGLTQAELAARVTVNGYAVEHAAVSLWETGKRNPPFNDKVFINALSSALKLDVKTVLNLSGYKIDGYHSQIGERGASIIDSLSDDKKQIALKMLESLMD